MRPMRIDPDPQIYWRNKVMSTHTKACKQKSQFESNQQNLDVNLQPKNSISRKIPSYVKKSITDACVEFAFLDNRSFETIKGDGFLNLIEKVFVAGQRFSGYQGVQMDDLLPDPTTVCR